MGDSKVTKGEIFELAQNVARDVNAANQRTHGLAFALDCLMDVLDTRLRCESDPPIAVLVKAEIQRRIEAAKTKPTPPPVVEKPPVKCECCGAPGKTDGLYGDYCDPCLNDISTIGECANTHVKQPVEQTPLISVP